MRSFPHFSRSADPIVTFDTFIAADRAGVPGCGVSVPGALVAGLGGGGRDGGQGEGPHGSALPFGVSAALG